MEQNGAVIRKNELTNAQQEMIENEVSEIVKVYTNEERITKLKEYIRSKLLEANKEKIKKAIFEVTFRLHEKNKESSIVEISKMFTELLTENLM